MTVSLEPFHIEFHGPLVFIVNGNNVHYFYSCNTNLHVSCRHVICVVDGNFFIHHGHAEGAVCHFPQLNPILEASYWRCVQLASTFHEKYTNIP